MQFLTLTLYAPMASFGNIAVGERRMSWVRPGKSTVMGLIAAAIGINRYDADEAHMQLMNDLYYAVQTVEMGLPLSEYHTSQTPRRSKEQYRTRRDELKNESRLSTVLSNREWRIDSFHVAVLWTSESSSIDLREILHHLEFPCFHLYLGRKSAPLGLPLNPQIIESSDLLDALQQRVASPPEKYVCEKIGHANQGQVAFDAGAPGCPSPLRIVTRRDGLVSRELWQFEDRDEGIVEITLDEFN